MLGYTSYIDKSINGIKTISDGFTVIQNGNIQTNNISTGAIDTNHINSDTGTIDNFTITTLTTNNITCSQLTLNNINTDEFETLDNIYTATTIQAQLNNKPNLNTTNTFTQTNTFTSIQTDNINIGLSGSIGTIGAPFIATQNNQITTKTYVDDAFAGIDYSIFPTLSGNNTFTGINTYWNNVIIDGGNHTIIPTIQRVNGAITTTPTYIGNLLPNGADGRNYLGPDSYFGGDVNVAYDLEVNNNISNGGTIFTNTISNNSTPLSIVSLSGLTLLGATTFSTSLTSPQGTITNLTDGTSPYITQATGDVRYFVNVNNYLKGFDEITNISQPSNSTL